MHTVLIVDDSVFMRMFIRKILERNGFAIIAEASGGEMGLDKYRQCRPDIVTLDVTMPQMNGLETLKSLMEIDSHAKVVMISALGQETIIRDAISLGAKTFIVKPFRETHIVSAIHKTLKHEG